ncbi:MAG TPA: outer membrane beta-barrel protein [Candidatus Saccharimonadia bacterium]|nr:outer membrane beta-barrel protein [Candidatus Saccharimonadia bacterium]
MKYLLILIAGVIMSYVAPANATDLRSTKDAPAFDTMTKAPIGFGGGYVGGSVNWSQIDVSQSASISIGDESASFGLPGMSGDEFSGGVQIGYNFEAGRLYGGPVVKFDLGGPTASLHHTFATDEDGEALATGDLKMTVNWTATLAGKGGIRVTDWLGVYGLLGIGFVDVDVDGRAHVGRPGQGIGLHENATDTVTAFTYGAGVDLKLSDNWRAFAEWQRFDLDTFNAQGSILFDQIRYGYKADSDLDVIRVGVNYAW